MALVGGDHALIQLGRQLLAALDLVGQEHGHCEFLRVQLAVLVDVAAGDDGVGGGGEKDEGNVSRGKETTTDTRRGALT